MLVAIGVLEIGKQTLCNMKGGKRTEKQWGWRDGFVLAMGGGRSDGLYPGKEWSWIQRRFLDGAFGPVEMGDLQHLC